MSSGDTYPARFIPLTVLHNGTVYLNEIEAAAKMGYPQPGWLLRLPGGRVASTYPIVTPLLVTPLYLPAVNHLDRHGWDDIKRVQLVGLFMEKLAASIVAATSVGLMYWLLRRCLARGRALLLVTAFALGTQTWVTSSQALWQHGTAELLIIIALLAVSGVPTTRSLVAAGLASGLLIANRPPDVVFAAAFAAYVPFWAWRQRRGLAFFAAAAIPLLLMVAYNWATFENLGGGYGYLIETRPGHSNFFSYPLAYGLAGLLLSPGKGLFVYSPFLLFLPWLFRRSLLPGRQLLTMLLLVAMTLCLAIYAKTDWRGGYTYGPRYLTDMVPILVWMLAPIVATLSRRALPAFVVAALFSAYVQVVGAFFYPGAGSDQLYYEEGTPNNPMPGVWMPASAAFFWETRASAEKFDFIRAYKTRYD